MTESQTSFASAGRPIRESVSARYPFSIRRVLLPVPEAEVEHLRPLGRREGSLRPGRVGKSGRDVVEEGDRLAAAVLRHARRPLRAVVGGDVPPRPLDHLLRHLDAELGRSRKAVEDVERHVGRRGAARPPREAADGRLRLPQLRERRLAVGLRDPGVEDVRQAVPGIAPSLRLGEPRHLLERHLPVRVGRVPALESGRPLRELGGHPRDGRDSRGRATRRSRSRRTGSASAPCTRTGS